MRQCWQSWQLIVGILITLKSGKSWQLIKGRFHILQQPWWLFRSGQCWQLLKLWQCWQSFQLFTGKWRSGNLFNFSLTSQLIAAISFHVAILTTLKLWQSFQLFAGRWRSGCRQNSLAAGDLAAKNKIKKLKKRSCCQQNTKPKKIWFF